jgi:predicted component of type VI protein secretion system
LLAEESFVEPEALLQIVNFETRRPSEIVYLRPHFRLDELTASIRLVAELPPPAAA